MEYILIVATGKKGIADPSNLNEQLNAKLKEGFRPYGSHSSGAEIYSGNGKWTKVQTISTTGNKAILEVKPNEPISSFNNQLLIRAQDSAYDLNGYGSVEMPHVNVEKHSAN